MTPPLLTIPEAATILRVTVARAYALTRSGALPVVRIGRQLRVASKMLDEYIERGGHVLNLEGADAKQ